VAAVVAAVVAVVVAVVVAAVLAAIVAAIVANRVACSVTMLVEKAPTSRGSSKPRAEEGDITASNITTIHNDVGGNVHATSPKNGHHGLHE